MKPVVGMALVFLGLTIGYLTLTGKLPPSTGGGPGYNAPTMANTYSPGFVTRQFQWGVSYR